jgi:hypothetical protein
MKARKLNKLKINESNFSSDLESKGFSDKENLPSPLSFAYRTMKTYLIIGRRIML